MKSGKYKNRQQMISYNSALPMPWKTIYAEMPILSYDVYCKFCLPYV